MKKALYTLIAIVSLSGISLGQTTNQNFIRSTTYQIPTTDGNVAVDAKIETISYFDGLGRNLQSTAVRAGGEAQNITSYSEYTPQGLQLKQYLPYASSSEPLEANRLDFINQATLKSNIESFYNTSKYENTLNPYSEVRFNQSYSEKLEVSAPGNAWALNATSDTDHTVKYEHLLNDDNEVLNFSVDFISGDTENPDLVLDGFYVKYDLSKKVVKDENWSPADGNNKTQQTFTSKQGQMLLKRNFNAGVAHDTYYIYDDFGKLTYVLSPEASNQIIDGSNNLVSGYQTVLNDYGYRYIYDARNRVKEKKLPGRDWEYIVYDRLDRVVLTQTGNQRANNQWSYIKYDKFGRATYSGLYTTTDTRATIESNIASATNLFEDQKTTSLTFGGAAVFYSNDAFPSTNVEVLSINYYDSYVDDAGLKANMPASVYGQGITIQTHGLLLVTKTKILGKGKWITSITGYDDKAHPIYAATDNDYLGTLDESMTRLDFVGKVLESNTFHSVGAGNLEITTKDFYTYDHMGRPLTHMQQINDEPLQLIAQNHYDELGSLEQKLVGGELFESGYTDIEPNTDVSSDGIITKQDGSGNAWNGGLATVGKLEADGGLSFTVNSTAVRMIVGLNDINNGTGTSDVDYGFFFTHAAVNPSYFKVRILNSNYLPPQGYNEGDTFAIERVGNDYLFYHNTELIYTHNAFSAPSLIGDVNLNTERSSIKDLQFYASTISTHLQEVDYKYNIRGWMTDVNDVDSPSLTIPDLFNFRLSYNSSVEGGLSFTPLYNGNISQTTWNSMGPDTDKRSYFYSYDDLNRITGAVSKKGTNLTTNDDYGMSVGGYDRNGNILSLVREGVDGTTYNPLQWDDLSYTYIGNQLKAVDDLASLDHGFIDGNTTATDFTYDGDGNMISDANKNITTIAYNHLDLPTLVTVAASLGSPGGTIEYVYDAAGARIQKIYTETGSSAETISYAGNYKYIGDQLQFFSHTEGYIEPVGGTGGSVKGYKSGAVTFSQFNYVFQFTDHLGNVRLSYSDQNLDGAVTSSEIIEESHFYPFGLEQLGYNNVIAGGNSMAQNYKFGGKELNYEFDLKWYDVSARNYDPALGRWMNIDPLAEQMRRHSPYNYGFDNPIYFMDYDGMSPTSPMFGQWLSGGSSGGGIVDFAEGEEPEEEEKKDEEENEVEDESSEDQHVQVESTDQRPSEESTSEGEISKSSKCFTGDCENVVEPTSPTDSAKKEIDDDRTDPRSFNFRTKGNWQEAATVGLYFNIKLLSLDPKDPPIDHRVYFAAPILFGVPANLKIGNVDISNVLAAELTAKVVEDVIRSTVRKFGRRPSSLMIVEQYFRAELKAKYPLYIPGGRVQFNAMNFDVVPTPFRHK